MYNSLCVLTHPQWPCGSPQCITVSTELHSVVAQGVFRFVNLLTLRNTIYKTTYNMHTMISKSNRFSTQLWCLLPTTHKYLHTSMHHYAPHKTVAISRINIPAWPWKSLVVTGTQWYERDPIDPRPTTPSSSKGHHSITIDPLHVSVCWREMKGGLREWGTANRRLIKIEPAWKWFL